MKLTAQEDDNKFQEMIAWYNAQVFNWFSHNDKSDGLGSSGIDEVMTRIGNLDINAQVDDDAQGDDDDQGAESANMCVCCYRFFYLKCKVLIIFWGKSGMHPSGYVMA